MSDRPTDLLHGKTPMETARKPHMDLLAGHGSMGLAKTLPEGMPTGSDVANLSILGYDPLIFHTGRSPIEALAMGVELEDTDLAFRCNLVTLSGEGEFEDQVMQDYSAGEIDTPDARELIQKIGQNLGDDAFKFYPGISYRHCMVCRAPADEYRLTPPHDITGKVIRPYLPEGSGAKEILRIMKEGHRLLAADPLNRRRQQMGLAPANALWLWGQGRRMTLEPFLARHGRRGSVISAVDLLKGIAIAAGLKHVTVEGATGNIHTNYRGKALAALSELQSGQDFVFIHVEAPDECGHQGNSGEKVRAIERIDEELLGTLLKGLAGTAADNGPFDILITPDHATPLDIKTHVRDPVPWLLYRHRSGSLPQSRTGVRYDERSAATAAAGRILKGTELIPMLFSGEAEDLF